MRGLDWAYTLGCLRGQIMRRLEELEKSLAVVDERWHASNEEQDQLLRVMEATAPFAEECLRDR